MPKPVNFPERILLVSDIDKQYHVFKLIKVEDNIGVYYCEETGETVELTAPQAWRHTV